jgi:hypothetical protein
MSFWRPSTIAKVYLSSFMCKTGFLRSLNYQIRLFLVPRLFWRWFSHDIATTRYITINMFIFGPSTIKSIYFFPWLFRKVIFAWRSAGSTCQVHVEVGPMSRGYLLPLSHSSFPLPNTSFSLSSHPYPERRSSRVVDSNSGKLVRWRKTRETARGSCDGACRAIRHEGLVWQSQNGSCCRARGERKKEDTEHVWPTMYLACGIHHHIIKTTL